MAAMFPTGSKIHVKSGPSLHSFQSRTVEICTYQTVNCKKKSAMSTTEGHLIPVNWENGCYIMCEL